MLKGLFDRNILYAGIIVAVLSILVAFLALRNMEETFYKDLDYTE
ncbi:hypothetical protein AAKU52_003385 [Pedobacter sp. CG_S7]